MVPPGLPPRTPLVDGLLRAVVDKRDGPLPAMLVALTMLAGVVDAASFLRLGGVFVATVTGNLVFVGLALAGDHRFTVLPCLLSIGGFAVGAIIGGRACRSSRSHRGRALRNVVWLKLTLAGVVTVMAVGSGGHLDLGVRDAMVVLLAMSMGTQLAAIRYLKVPDLPTAALTLTITGALSERGLGAFHPAVLRRLVAMLAFVAGALSGALLALYVGLSAALGLGLAIIVGVAIAARLASRSSEDWTTPS
jgi:uncharacterized membrane protein YoaK (UPF0700 family)